MAAQADAHLITPNLPRSFPRLARMKVEKAIEQHLAAVEALTAFLDEVDGDPECEPSLGSVNPSEHNLHLICANQENWACGGTDDRELADDRQEGGDEEIGRDSP